MRKIFIMLCASISVFAARIDIYNDSTYTLEATIYSAKHAELASMTVTPRHTIKWQDSLFDARDYSKGPFYVVFTCPNGDFFGKSHRVGENATVQAMRSSGPKNCGSHTQPDPHRDDENRKPHIY
jgi:hypothetical protein